ncbi:MAG: hypothetical protein KDD70_19005, partial [Bdellovibrionales bacterium]|nr:hypothetical protein [Bdellovibrionales bacterium]
GGGFESIPEKIDEVLSAIYNLALEAGENPPMFIMNSVNEGGRSVGDGAALAMHWFEQTSGVDLPGYDSYTDSDGNLCIVQFFGAEGIVVHKEFKPNQCIVDFGTNLLLGNTGLNRMRRTPGTPPTLPGLSPLKLPPTPDPDLLPAAPTFPLRRRNPVSGGLEPVPGSPKTFDLPDPRNGHPRRLRRTEKGWVEEEFKNTTNATSGNDAHIIQWSPVKRPKKPTTPQKPGSQPRGSTEYGKPIWIDKSAQKNIEVKNPFLKDTPIEDIEDIIKDAWDNDPDFISEALRSLKKTTGQDYGILLNPDGSPAGLTIIWGNLLPSPTTLNLDLDDMIIIPGEDPRRVDPDSIGGSGPEI